jgi:SAM-dependent methyltransferase
MQKALGQKDPRWGSDHRDEKALTIFNTLTQVAGQGIADGCWLDIGCGSGGIANALAPFVGSMVGVDPEPWHRWSEERGHASAVFHVGTYEDLPDLLGGDSVDVVICNQVYEHVPSPEGLIRAIAKVLKPGGVCYFAGPNLLWPIEPHVHWPILHWLPRGLALAAMKALGSRRSGDLDAWSLDAWRLIRLFRSAGLASECAIAERLWAEAALFPQRRAVALVARFPRFVFQWMLPFSPGFVFVLRKPMTPP